MRSNLLLSIILSVLLSATACAPGTKIRQVQGTTVNVTEKVESKYTGPKRRIGVVSFENKAPYAQARIGNTATDILVTELVKSGKFIVVGRDCLDKVMDEQKLGQT